MFGIPLCTPFCIVTTKTKAKNSREREDMSEDVKVEEILLTDVERRKKTEKSTFLCFFLLLLFFVSITERNPFLYTAATMKCDLYR
jgi:hypothetical protein